MPNYKPVKLDYTGENFRKFTPLNSITKILYHPHQIVAGPKSMRDCNTDAVYIVPTGKTFHATVLMIAWGAGGNSLYQIHSGDTLDAQTLQKIYYDLTSAGAGVVSSYPLLFEIPAGKYVTGDPLGSIVRIGWCIGYET